MAMSEEEILRLKRASVLLAEIAVTLSDHKCRLETLVKAVSEVEPKKSKGDNDNGRHSIN